MNRVLFFDVETTGVDPAKDEVIEAAGILWSVQHESTISGFSFVFAADENPAEAVNAIPAGLLRSDGAPVPDAWKRVSAWMARADVVVAHNAPFDRAFAVPHISAAAASRPWVCTQDDVDWPRAAAGSKLTDILLAHGLGISHAHRALVDVMNLARLFERVGELGTPARALLERAMRPKRTYQAHVSFRTNGLAKEAGFRWDPERKMWWRRIAEEDVAEVKSRLRFDITAVD